MTKWLQVFENKRDQKQGKVSYACPSCQTRYSPDHGETPPNGVCHCERCSGKVNDPSFVQNFDSIQWSKESKLEWRQGPGGKKIAVAAGTEPEVKSKGIVRVGGKVRGY